MLAFTFRYSANYSDKLKNPKSQIYKKIILYAKTDETA